MKAYPHNLITSGGPIVAHQRDRLMSHVLRIERTRPRGGVAEHPALDKGKYVLGDPKAKGRKHCVENAVYARTIEEAAALVEAGHSLRMGRPGKWPSMICPASLRIVRA